MPLSHLVLVCCHATFKGGNPADETSWILQDFQRSDPGAGKVGEHHTFTQHISAAVDVAARDPNALLIFSGGKTQDLVNLTEAESYRSVCTVLDGGFHRERCEVETCATDSFQNLLFSIVRFRRLTGSYPEHITVITHAFKERRFLELHGPAIKYPKGKLRVLGLNPAFTFDELEDVQRGEQARGYDAFARDLYGVKEPLSGKRRARGWDDGKGMGMGMADGLEEEVQRLLLWKGGDDGKDVFGGRLPWEIE